MKILILLLLVSSAIQAQKISDTLWIDVVLIYERVLENGYESEEIYLFLQNNYSLKNDTIKLNAIRRKYEVYKNR